MSRIVHLDDGTAIKSDVIASFDDAICAPENLARGFNSTNFWNLVRRDRNQRLAVSDWTQLDDCKLSMTKKGEWAEYRQALREVPVSNSGSTMLDQIVWPDQPS